MNIYYFDSSAIVKRYAEERGSKWVKQITAPESGHLINITQLGIVEVAAAFSRKVREKIISEDERDRVLGIFLKDCEEQYQVIEVDNHIIKLAVSLTSTNPLRGYDAIQLATASLLNSALVSRRVSPLIFVSADDNLVEVAKEKDILVDNPNLYS